MLPRMLGGWRPLVWPWTPLWFGPGQGLGLQGLVVGFLLGLLRLLLDRGLALVLLEEAHLGLHHWSSLRGPLCGFLRPVRVAIGVLALLDAVAHPRTSPQGECPSGRPSCRRWISSSWTFAFWSSRMLHLMRPPRYDDLRVGLALLVASLLSQMDEPVRVGTLVARLAPVVLRPRAAVSSMGRTTPPSMRSHSPCCSA